MADSPKESIREEIERFLRSHARALSRIYSFVHRFRPAVAEETIRARVYEAVEKGTVRRVARGVYVARDGPATLLLVEGDARDVLHSLEDGAVDAIITDPPYDLGTRQHAMTGSTRPHMGKGRTYEQWDLDRSTLLDMFRVLSRDKSWNTLSKAKRRDSKFPTGGGALVLFVPPITRNTWTHIRNLVDLAQELGFVFQGTITWDHEIMGMGYDCGRNRKNELLFFTAGPRRGVLWDLSLPNVLRYKRTVRRDGEHEAEKPIALFTRFVEALTRPGDIVADFFVGRGRWNFAPSSGRSPTSTNRVLDLPSCHIQRLRAQSSRQNDSERGTAVGNRRSMYFRFSSPSRRTV